MLANELLVIYTLTSYTYLLGTWELDIIAHQANLDVKKVRNWFNNTRARQKCGGK
jgi:hypothetical protein